MIHGKPIKTTISDKAAPCLLDHVNRPFKAPRPNVLWLSDFTYVATWTGFVYVAFVIDAYARRIVVAETARARLIHALLARDLHDKRYRRISNLSHEPGSRDSIARIL
ncbi:transposase InsO family protein [Bradyrhizobium sp. USDA 3240]